MGWPGQFSDESEFRLREKLRLKILPAVLLLLALNGAAEGQRLPASVIPSHYKLFIDPSIESQRFSGEETIDVRLAQSTKEIVLNSLDLDVSAAEVIAGGTTQPAQVSYDKPAEVIRLAVAPEIPPGPAVLHLKFSGALTDGLRGLYLSKTKRRSYAVTQFEGTYARMMFPSFDEPGFKATFGLTVSADKQDTAISNGRIIDDVPTPGSNRHTLTFSTSPKMSTYLVAVAIGDWQCLERTVDGVPIRVCAVPENKDKAKFALEVAAHSIQFYNRWYGIKYPFGKLDMLAIPDYEWGGMENTASIFYRDTALLMDEATASVFTRRRQATVIAHEIAHQWFGDLVTPAWWDDIWLNEGFATWMQAKPIEAWHPEWDLEDDEAVAAQEIIGIDSLGATRAIHGDPKTSAEIKEMFDGITYEKGGAVLSMLESYVGPEVFRKGVNAYLLAHANGNATSSDFWKAEAQASGKPIDQLMPTFVLQPGVPLLSVTSSCGGGKAQAEFTQQRFFLSPERLKAGSPEQWQIPVCMKWEANGACALITAKTQQVPIAQCSSWLFANRDAKGYYRVAYTEENLNAVAKVAEKELNARERIALMEDAWAMTRVGKSAIGDFLGLAQALRSERDLAAINLLAGHLTYAGDTLVPESQSEDYRKFIRKQFDGGAQELGWAGRPGDSDEQKAIRASLLGILGRTGDQEAITTARTLVQNYMHNSSSVEGTLVTPAFTTAAAQGDATLYEQITAALPKARSTEEYNTYLLSLAGFKDAALVGRTIALVDEGKVRQQEYPVLFSALLANPQTSGAAWTYLKAHWSDLAEKVTSFGGTGAVSALGNFCSAERRIDVEQFFQQHRAPGAERTVSQSLERIDNCIEFKAMQQQNMESWLTLQK
jgi:aminopeptidase N/puromycin-sensitive aminopeptidase